MKILTSILLIVIIFSNLIYIRPALAGNSDISQSIQLNRLKNSLKGHQVIPKSNNPEQIGKNLVSLIFKLIIMISGAVFMILLLIGGIQYMVAGGYEEASAKAKRMLLDAVIGLVIVLGAYAAGNWIINLFT